MESQATHDVLLSRDYKLVEDAWCEFGRRTYIHDDNATREYFSALAEVLRSAGWQLDSTTIHQFCNRTTGEIIEVEPGGSEATGHFLHHMKSMPA